MYKWAAQKLNAEPEYCLFIAAHSWDVAGAMAAGMQAAFISRPGQTQYPLAPQPEYIVSNLKALTQKIFKKKKAAIVK